MTLVLDPSFLDSVSAFLKTVVSFLIGLDWPSLGLASPGFVESIFLGVFAVAVVAACLVAGVVRLVLSASR